MTYGFCLDICVNQVFNLFDVCIETIIRFKNKINYCVEQILEGSIEKIGEINRNVQIDEIAFQRGELVSNPTSELYNNRDTIWIIGGILDMMQEEKENRE